MRKAVFFTICIGLLLSSAKAATDAACWYRNLEQVDATMDPPQGGDNKFFTSADVAPNLMWVLDTSGSMQTLPCNGDCDDFSACGSGFGSYGNNFFTARSYKGYTTDSAAYDAFDPDFCSTSGNARAFSGNDGCYKPGLVYQHNNDGGCGTWPSDSKIWTRAASSDTAATIPNWCGSTYPVKNPTSPLNSPSSCSSDSACPSGYRCLNSTGGTSGSKKCRIPNNCSTTSNYTCPANYTCNASNGDCEDWRDRDTCITSLTTNGYNPGSKNSNPAFTGDVLNFYPPKFVVARQALKDLALKLKRTRQALMVFDNDSVGGDGNGGRLMTEFGLPPNTTSQPTSQSDNGRPTCDKFVGPDGKAIVPSDSDFAANANDIIAKVNTAKFVSGTPLGETLTSAAQYFTANATRFSGSVKVNGSTGVGDSDSDIPNRSSIWDPICFSCQKNFVAVITDGSPSVDESVPCKLRNYDKDCKEGLQSSPNCSTVSTSVCPTSQRRTYSQTGGYDYFDDVASFVATEDLRPEKDSSNKEILSGAQNLIVHTIGFGVRAPILEDAARLGGGLNLYADDADQLRSALFAVAEDVNKRATSFSVASVTTVQTRGSTYAFVPRFRPATDDLWEGHLYRFKLFNEFAAGCTTQDTNGTMTVDKLSRNPNGDADCDDVYLQDANNAFVQEDGDGAYMLADISQPWVEGTGWPLRSPAVAATPVWDAMSNLQSRNLSSDARSIYTVVDANANGVFEPSEQIAFTEGNVASLVNALALGGVSGPTCATLASKLTKTYSTESACALDLIKFVRGQDVLDDDKDNNTTEARSRILGDIFHSSPILLTAPVSPLLCDLGVSSQCVYSLYSNGLTPKGSDAYQTWMTAQKERTQVVLVGANDGMLHAFHAGDWQNGDDPDSVTVETRYLNLGTGRELWAFIPPDMLPKLKRLILRDGRHELFVDGTAMVRDIWVDSTTNPGQKDSSEFKTIAVIGERQGGRSWMAIDVSTPATPAFRWSYPPIGDTFALASGESWADFAPGAPPIGPVAVADTNGPLTVDGTKAKEVWSVFLGGGYDANLMRGRSISALNVWTGAEMWRFAASDTTSASDLRRQLFPVAAPVAMFDFGASARVVGKQEGLFDTAVVGDIMGQVWAIRFRAPGQDTNGDGLFDNWFAARSFIQFKGDAMSKRSPFFQMAEAAVSPSSGEVKVYMGGGDRANIRDRDGGNCSVTNMQSCIRKGCDLNISTDKAHNGSLSFDGSLRYQPNGTGLTTNTLTFDSLGAQNACTDVTDFAITTAVSCNNGTVSDSWDWALKCDWNSSDGSLCSTTKQRPEPTLYSLNFTASTTNARFYGFTLFDNTRQPFASSVAATTYDTAALSDVNLSDADTTSGTVNGWYVNYGLQNERTSSAAVVLGGCVLWNTLNADTSPVVCGTKVNDEARMYRGHYGTGSKQCGLLQDPSLARAEVRRSIVPPSAPTSVVAFNAKTGEVRYSTVGVEAGSLPNQTEVGISDLAGTVFWLEVPREVHECRHGTAACN